MCSKQGVDAFGTRSECASGNSRSASVQYTEIYLKTESVYAQIFFCVISGDYISGEFLGLFSEN